MGARRRTRGRIGLALAGGGPVGAVYEIGALRALDEAIEGLDLNDLHIYVGVSAGSLVAAFLANGMSTAHLVRILAEHEPADPLLPAVFFTPAYREFIARGMQLPLLITEAVLTFLERPNIFRSASRLARAIPTAVFDNAPLRTALEEAFARAGRTNDFRELSHRLIVVATDLATGTAIRFGDGDLDAVPISRAVQASCALPGLYPPVSIDGRCCVDGVLLKTVHASVAFDHGADLVVCVNPIVPVDTSAGVSAGELPRGALVRGGLPTLMSQTFRTMIHSRLSAGFATYPDRYPDSQFVLFEPPRDEYDMFFSNVFSLSSRRNVCDLAYHVTRRDLLLRYDRLAPTFARAGLRLRRDVLEDVTRDVWEGVGVPRPSGLRHTSEKVTSRLHHVLDRLEAVTQGHPAPRRRARLTTSHRVPPPGGGRGNARP
jgi:predicted acylesterase/phospholipase RssA